MPSASLAVSARATALAGPVVRAAIAATAALLSAPATAAPLTYTAWFQGTVRAADPTLQYPPDADPARFVGAPASGSLRIELDDVHAAAQPFDQLVPLGAEGRVDLRLRFADVDLRYGSGADGLWEVAPGGGYAAFRSDFRPRFEGYIVSFRSAAGALLDGPTPADLRLDSDTVSGIDVYAASARHYGAFQFDITSFGFGSLAPPVPEPAVPALLGVGLAVVAWVRRRSAAATPCTHPSAAPAA